MSKRIEEIPGHAGEIAGGPAPGTVTEALTSPPDATPLPPTCAHCGEPLAVHGICPDRRCRAAHPVAP